VGTQGYPCLTIASFPQTYLGLPLTASKVRASDLQPLVQAVDRYIPDWCGATLTASGRTILTNAVLSAWAVYVMGSILLSKGVIEAVDARWCTFIWASEFTCHGGQYKATCDMVCWDRSRSGLGSRVSHYRTGASSASLPPSCNTPQPPTATVVPTLLRHRRRARPRRPAPPRHAYLGSDPANAPNASCRHQGSPGQCVDAKSALNANHTASRTKLASHAQRANDVPVNFS
jgi:hypothetical protein